MDNRLDLINALNAYIESMNENESIICVSYAADTVNLIHTVNGNVDELAACISHNRADFAEFTNKERTENYIETQDTIVKMALCIAMTNKDVALGMMIQLKKFLQ